MKTPRLPAVLVGVLGALATVLTAVGPSLPSPWDVIVAGVLGVLTLLGVTATVGTMRRSLDAADARGFESGAQVHRLGSGPQGARGDL